MSKKLIDKIKFIDLVLIIAVIMLIIINLVLYLKKVIEPEQQQVKYKVITATSDEKTVTKNISIKDEDVIKYLSKLNEGDRMRYYCGKYFECVENKDYESAYSMLYPEFKEKYFKTIDDYISYIGDFYPEFYGLEYDDVSRQGDIFVVRVKVINLSDDNEKEGSIKVSKSGINGTKENDAQDSDKKANVAEEPGVQRFVIRENYYNDFDFSFQVKKSLY